MLSFRKAPHQPSEDRPEDTHLPQAAAERMAELARYSKWERHRSGGAFASHDEISRNLRRIRELAPQYALLAGSAPETEQLLNAIMTDTGVAMAKLRLRKQHNDRINTNITATAGANRPKHSSDDQNLSAAFIGVSAGNLT